MKAPAAKREFLVLLAGILWLIVGSVLIVGGVSWLEEFNSLAVISVLAATVAGAAIAHFGFSPLPARIWRGYMRRRREKTKSACSPFRTGAVTFYLE
jgi:hypothetical protein